MSSSTTDLIDFHVGPTVLPTTSETNTTFESDNLIDTELPVFEQKLLTQSTNLSSSSRRDSVDVEDILIKIDSDEEYERDSLDGEEVECGDFLDVCDPDETSLPVDNFEALLVLKNLDDLLNATLAQSDDIVNGNVPGQLDDDTQYVIEECLGELDNYLEAIDDNFDSYSNSSESYTEPSLEVCTNSVFKLRP